MPRELNTQASETVAINFQTAGDVPRTEPNGQARCVVPIGVRVLKVNSSLTADLPRLTSKFCLCGSSSSSVFIINRPIIIGSAEN